MSDIKRKPSIILEDNHLLVINKPAGVLVQGDHTGDTTLLDWGKAYLKKKYNKEGNVYLGAAHRIDRPTSGAVLFGRTSKALPRLNQAFKDKKVEKTYFALALAAPFEMEGTLRHFLEKNPEKNTVTAYKQAKQGAKEAILHYRYVGETEQKHHLIEVKPITGRSHQIRVQLASIGCSLLGDLRYGANEPLPDASIGLHCYKMAFLHPVRKEPVVVEADFPDKPWWALAERLL